MDRALPSQHGGAFRTELDAAGERLIIPIRLGWRPFVWAGLGTGIMLYLYLLQPGGGVDYFDLSVKVAFAYGAIAFLISLAASRLAEEVIQIVNGQLVHSWRLLGFKRGKSYSVAEIRALGIALYNFSNPREGQEELVSFQRDFGKRGVIKFDTEKRSVYLGITLDDAAAKDVVAWLARRLPASACA